MYFTFRRFARSLIVLHFLGGQCHGHSGGDVHATRDFEAVTILSMLQQYGGPSGKTKGNKIIA